MGMRDDQFQVNPKKVKKPAAKRSEPVGFYIGQKPVGVFQKAPQISVQKVAGKRARSIVSAIRGKRRAMLATLRTLKPPKKPLQKPKGAVLKRAIVLKQTNKQIQPKRKLRARTASMRKKDIALYAGLGALGIAMGVGGLLIRGNNTASQAKPVIAAQTPQDTEVLGATSGGVPDFTTVKPATTPVQISYDAEKKIAVFQDTIGNQQINITQQPYPEQLKNTTNGLQALAKSLNNFKSYSSFATSSKGTVHSTTLKSGAQTLIFVAGDLLVFVNANTTIPEEQWAGYLEALL